MTVHINRTLLRVNIPGHLKSMDKEACWEARQVKAEFIQVRVTPYKYLD